MAKGFASTTDLAEKKITFSEIGTDLYAFTAEGDPNSAIIVGDDGCLVFDAQSTPAMANKVIERVRTVTDKPIKYVVLSHYHAVRVLGASAYKAQGIVASAETHRLIGERGQQDWDSEYGRFPRLFQDAQSIPGLTWPTLTFEGEMSIYLGKREVRLMQLGAGHTSGDIVAWVPDAEVMFSGDLIEYHSACYCGDAHLREWPATLNEIRAFNPKAIAPGRGDALKGLSTGRDAIAMTRDFVTSLYGAAESSVAKGRTLKETFATTREVMDPKFSSFAIYEHCLPFNVSRAFDEASGIDDPVIWTDKREPGNVGRPARRRMTMNINTSPNQIVRSSAQLTPGYMSGFGNSFETEALPGALPMGRNSPQRCAYGLYAEQLSGSPFTAPRGSNERSWLYRIRPSVKHSGRFAKADAGLWRTAPCHEYDLPIAQLRWDPAPIPKEDVTFLQGVQTMTTAGDANTQAGMAAHVYLITKSMVDQHFYNADGEMMFVAQQGNLCLVTEFGRIDIEPGEIAVIPRGVKFRVEIPSGPARGYLCENYGGAFTLPERGPIGANCLANSRDFLTPVAAYEDKDAPTELYVKWGGSLFKAILPHSPIDVVAWHGNYAPYKYDLRTFSPVGAIGFDHPDPSIFTVLTSPSETAGTANIDFVIFPERWAVAENTFRPPWYHMNIMSEFMGLIYGVYDAKPEGFVPGGISLHNMMLPHGPDRQAFDHASNGELKPVKLTGTMAFMFETRFPQRVTQHAATSATLQDDYADCWKGLEKRFDPNKP
ncbi:homogentisate 1,2-dioxygenase [Bradyrhizobium sp. AZCC 1620]